MSNRRVSLLGQASDALASFRFGRRRTSIRQTVEPVILAVPHVIDIAPPDEELEERQRLRHAAAHSIGLLPLFEDKSPEEKEEEEQEPPQEPPQQENILVLPPFPASHTAITPFAALTASLPKYYPPRSLRIFALAKQWKSRHLILSVPTGRVSHLHLFKSEHPDDRELERLEIDADSDAFVAEAVAPSSSLDLTHVVKVAGKDVGARRRDWNPTDDAARTVWLLHLATPADAQRWISVIKAAIFEQRTHRAGLPSTLALGPEPRGDMDVMLSMRIAASPPSSAAAFQTSHSPASPDAPPQPPTPTSLADTCAASLAPSASERSVRSVATAPAGGRSLPGTTRTRPASTSNPAKGAGTAAVAAIKGLFHITRPRSASAASVTSSTSFDVGSSSSRHASYASYSVADDQSMGDSFAYMGSILASGVNSNGVSAHHPAAGPEPALTAARRSFLPLGDGPSGNRASVLGRRIVGQNERERAAEPHEADTYATTRSLPPKANGHANTNGEVGESAGRRTVAYDTHTVLQPPPRARLKHWTESGVEKASDEETNGWAANGQRGGSPVPEMYIHSRASGSGGTAGSFGVRAPSVVPGTGNGNAYLGAPDRLSERSVSSGRSRSSSAGNVNGSASGNVNGNGTTRSNSGRGRRWSTLPRRLTPPAPRPAPAQAALTIPHPYAASASSAPHERERTSSRASEHSFGSTGNGKGVASGWTRGKRVSGVSVGSTGGLSVAGTSVSGVSVGGASASSGGTGRVRSSVPPPPRPAPTSALPPAPRSPEKDVEGMGTGTGSPNGHTSFRDSRSSSLSVSFRDVAPPPVASSSSFPATQIQQNKPPAVGNAHAKGSFRESVSLTHRALRMSLMTPKPPPTDVLPPRPDEVQHQPSSQAAGGRHRRSNSAGASAPESARSSILSNKSKNSLGLHVIPGSPMTPPPRGPLPPTPEKLPAPAPAPARHSSLRLKQRLRILSAPPMPQVAPSPEPEPVPRAARPTSADSPGLLTPAARAAPGAMTLSSFLSVSASTPSTPTIPGFALPAAVNAANGTAPQHGTPPATPIGEKILPFTDPSFLQLSAASTPVLRPLSGLPENEDAEIPSLLPPPRRGSRQLSVMELDLEPAPDPEPAPPFRDQEAEGVGPGPGKLFSLSRQGSVISLGIVTM
ncbi:hypothetical protein GGX14DRAFT_564724 [Mycena pura]|uniref:PH domain-containing protein n=1 Tax=Mycena pura TaxID=153505 RepID=A0AAD6VK15_9AGAR|nr:hypothetical protein GGX14DRAFT_564724 [Mycena pura]